MITAKAIRNGLDFLIKEAEEIGGYIETGADHDVFYVGLHHVNLCAFRIGPIQAQMKKFGWIQVEDSNPLGFTHIT